VTFSTPLPVVYDNPTNRWSMSNAWVDEPGRTSTTWEMLAASGVETVNAPAHEMLGGTLAMVGRVAAIKMLLESLANR